MKYPYPECGDCEVYGYCTGTEEEHQAYINGFAWQEKPGESECSICEVMAYCTQTEDECETYQTNKMIRGESGFARTVRESGRFPANKGLVNRLCGCIVEIDEGEYMAKISLNVGGNLLTTIMPLQKFRELGYKKGDNAAVAFKAMNVKMMR